MYQKRKLISPKADTGDSSHACNLLIQRGMNRESAKNINRNDAIEGR